MASIRHRVMTGKKNAGKVVWQVRYRDDDGTQRSESFSTSKAAQEFKSLVEALGWREALEILNDSADPMASTPRLRDWCETYIETRTGITNGTRTRYRLHASSHLGPLGARPVDKITPALVAKWVNAMSEEGLAGKTISNRHGFLSGAMTAAVRAGHAASNPCEGTRLPKTERQEMIFLTGSEFALLLSHVRINAQPFVALMPATGLRWGEITALQPRDIDLEAGTLTVSRSWKYVEGKGKKAELGPPKTPKSRRTIALPRQAVDILRDAIEGKRPEDFIFTNSVGNPWTGSRFHEGVWQPAVRAANKGEGDRPILGKRPGIHSMRHTCASWMVKAGVPLPVIQRHLGHESIQTTIDRYSHLEPEQLLAAGAALSSAMTLALPEIES